MKKIIVLGLFAMVFVLQACSSTPVACGEGTVAVGSICEVVPNCTSNELYDASTNTCEAIEVEEEINDNEIQLVDGAKTNFEVGDTLPDFSSYFTANGSSVSNSMIEHTLLLDASNTMTTPGVYSVTARVGSEVLTINITVSDPSIDYSDIVTEGQAGIYINTQKQTEFDVGDYMPNFMLYFVAYDGSNYLTITPDLILHNLLLNAENRMTQAGDYMVWMELNINGQLYRKEVTIKVLPIGGSTVESIGQTGWEIINSEFTDANVFDAWMIPNGDVTVTNENGEVDIHVNMIGMNFWDILFAQPGKTFEKGYTYQVTFRMKTALQGGRDVVVFAEPSQGAAKLLEQQVSLTTTYQDFTFTFVSTSNTTTGMIGVFLGANLPGANPGSVIIDSIILTRTGEKTQDVMLTDLPNQTFTSSDISMWDTEGKVELTHNSSGYLEANVTGYTGAFYQENIQLGGFYVTAGVTYQVSFTVRTSIVGGRDITFFVENTDAGFAKYFEITESITSTFQTFTYTFTPSENNDDTKVGIFLGDMENAGLGIITIDSIVITVIND